MLKNYDKKEILRNLKNIMLTIVGTVILAFGTAVFIIPFDLVMGGMSGIAIVVAEIINISAVTPDIIIAILTWALFFLGLFVLGRAFALKTLISCVVYPPFVSIFMKLSSPDVLGGYFYMGEPQNAGVAVIIAAVIGGAIIGAGCAIAFLGGGSTGGTDILAFIVSRIFPKIKSSVSIFLIDALIILLGAFLAEDIIITLLGIVCAFVNALVVDRIFLGGSAAFVAQIVTDNPEAITQQIIEKLERTATVIDVTGAYSGQRKKMVMASFNMREYTSVMAIVSKEDPTAFVTVHKAHEINGEGWTR
jgi:uncharacterized membrane-anchored protein YitT (DUF2179 family)